MLITDIGILAIANSCPLLSNIELSECKKITDIGISAIAHGCPLLSSINLEDCDEITDIGISSLVMHCRFLSMIDVEGCLHISRGFIIDLGSDHPKLRIIQSPDDYFYYDIR